LGATSLVRGRLIHLFMSIDETTTAALDQRNLELLVYFIFLSKPYGLASSQSKGRNFWTRGRWEKIRAEYVGKRSEQNTSRPRDSGQVGGVCFCTRAIPATRIAAKATK